MRVKLEDVCERDSSNLKQSDVLDKTGDYPIYGASGFIGNVDFYQQDVINIVLVHRYLIFQIHCLLNRCH